MLFVDITAKMFSVGGFQKMFFCEREGDLNTSSFRASPDVGKVRQILGSGMCDSLIKGSGVDNNNEGEI